MFWKRPKARATPATPGDELAGLRQASTGLVYPSESDAPFDVFRWEDKGGQSAKAQVVAHANAADDESVEETSLDAFFAPLAGAEDAARFSQLRRELESTLSAPTVVRVGERKIDVYLIGRTRTGAWAGVHTSSVET
jgi:hypothetical protein